MKFLTSKATKNNAHHNLCSNYNCNQILEIKSLRVSAPNRRRIWHDDVIIVSKYSHVWTSGVKKGYLGLDMGLSGDR